jgi:hypothetical protein
MVMSMCLLDWFRVGAAALALVVLASPARAVTCDEVRAMKANDLSYWAGRLEVTPDHLAALLDKAFCQVGGRERVNAPGSKRERAKSINRNGQVAVK